MEPLTPALARADSGSGRSFRLQPRAAGLPRQGSGVSLGSKGSTGTKKLSIRPFEKAVLPAEFESEAWGKLRAAVEAVLEARAADHTDEELYSAVRDLCDHGLAEGTAAKLRSLVSSYTTSTIKRLLADTVVPDAEFLVAAGRLWDDRSDKLMTISRLFAWLDTTHLRQRSQKSIWEQGLELLSKGLQTEQDVLRKLLRSMLATVKAERSGSAVQRGLMSKLAKSLASLGLYKQHFEAGLLKETADFYETEGQAVCHPDTPVGKYLRLVEQRLDEEEDRVRNYLEMSTRRELIAIVEVKLVKTHAATILERGLGDLLNGMMLPELGLLYSQFGLSNVGCRPMLRDAFKAHIKEKGARMVMDEQGDPHMIPDLLKFRRDLDLVLRDAFAGRKEFQYALRDSFAGFINMRANRPAELLAKFLDQKQRASSKEADEDLEPLMEQCLDLFRMVHSKDMFLAFYQKDFAKRLLLGRSASIENEKAFLSKLKQEGGPGFTNKLEGMLNDMETSASIAESFKASRADSADPIDLNVQVLTQSFWPTTSQADVKIPPDMAGLLDSFKHFYLLRHKGRCLQWQANLCMCSLRAAFPSGRKELVVSLFQTLVLLAFNDGKEYTFAELQQHTGIEGPELKTVVQSLALSNVRVLRRLTKGPKLLPTDVFTVNEDFKHKQHKIRINQAQAKETKEEQKKTSDQVVQDRAFAIDACVVRTMKSRRVLRHQDLVAAVFAGLKFPVTGGDVKKRIESLIERDYLRRDDENTSSYHYVA
eukprot:TRINITY_DN1906_c0_g1_i1.p2 TRINITY_DN1906_c0_g1~~TRINITY_DN1906_c0_g1_i1.p2  ORF type:complete len:763 (+),score=319.14 TRINITY_DN1906_c0_g1_i1:62-2350(+)